MGKGKRKNKQQHAHGDKYAPSASEQDNQQNQRPERSSDFSERSSQDYSAETSPAVDDFGQGPEHYEGR